MRVYTKISPLIAHVALTDLVIKRSVVGVIAVETVFEVLLVMTVSTEVPVIKAVLFNVQTVAITRQFMVIEPLVHAVRIQ